MKSLNLKKFFATILGIVAMSSCSTTASRGDAVDLGLSVKWGTCNIGATKPEEYGNYYAWGETSTKENYTPGSYKFLNIIDTTLTKYCHDSRHGTPDGKSRLEKNDDVASVVSGGKWRMPTKQEIEELIEKCSWSWTSINGVLGYVVTGSNGNSIFLPASGAIGDKEEGISIHAKGTNLCYWGAEISVETDGAAFGFFAEDGEIGCGLSRRFYGKPVRPVLAE